jgi:TRAP-type C4-dicarboxylate transport system permease small subunit
MNEIGQDTASSNRSLEEGPIEFACRMLCRLALIALVGIIDVELVTRNLFNFSFYLSDEYGGYILVALTFLSLPLCVTHNSFHRVTFLLAQLPPAPRDVFLLCFDLLALIFSLIILYEVVSLVQSSYALQTNAPTLLLTPLWLPQLVMPIGAVALSITLGRSVVRRFKQLLARVHGDSGAEGA